MSENKEVTTGPIEEWGSLSDDTKAVIDQMSENSGMSMFKAKEVLLFTNPEKGRINKIAIALTFAIGSMVVEKSRITGGVKTENCGSIISTHEGDDFSVIFMKYDKADEDQYRLSRTLQLEKVNELLKTFDKKPLPPYTSEGRKI